MWCNKCKGVLVCYIWRYSSKQYSMVWVRGYVGAFRIYSLKEKKIWNNIWIKDRTHFWRGGRGLRIMKKNATLVFFLWLKMDLLFVFLFPPIWWILAYCIKYLLFILYFASVGQSTLVAFYHLSIIFKHRIIW